MTSEERIERLLRAFEDAWAARDGTAAARLFSEDAVFTTPTFERAIGRAAIARSEQQAYDTYFSGTRVRVAVERLVFLRDDLALLHTTNSISRDDAVMVESHAMLVVDGRTGDWEIVGWHNMVPLGRPPD